MNPSGSIVYMQPRIINKTPYQDEGPLSYSKTCSYTKGFSVIQSRVDHNENILWVYNVRSKERRHTTARVAIIGIAEQRHVDELDRSCVELGDVTIVRVDFNKLLAVHGDQVADENGAFILAEMRISKDKVYVRQ